MLPLDGSPSHRGSPSCRWMIAVLPLMGHRQATMDHVMPLDGSPPCRWVDRRRASPLWLDRGRGLLDFVVGSGVDEFAVGLCWLLTVWIGN